MSRPRFLVRMALAAGATITLPESVSHHARRVLRLGAGATVMLFDGNGNEYEAILEPDPTNASRLQAAIVHGGPVDREAMVPITLVQALIALEKMDWVVEKCVELGAHRLILAPAARSVVRLDGERGQRRLERWRDLAAAACCQCGRNRIPEVALAPNVHDALSAAALGGTARYVLDPAARRGLLAGARGTTAAGAGGHALALAVGPEGGFSAAELGLAQELGYEAVRLGPRVLRTETAGLLALGALLAERGEYC